MGSKKFAKALKKIIKSDYMDLDPWFVVVLSGYTSYMMNQPEENRVDESILDDYRSIITKLLKKDVKRLTKKYNISEVAAYNILVEAPNTTYCDDPKYIIPYANRIYKKMYGFIKEDEDNTVDAKTLRKVVKDVYGKEYIEYFALAALLERKDAFKHLNDEQKNVWSMITSFALDYIEKQSKEDIRRIISNYAKRRESDAKRDNGTVVARRIDFSSINTEDYPKITNVVEKLKKKNNIREFI